MMESVAKTYEVLFLSSKKSCGLEGAQRRAWFAAMPIVKRSVHPRLLCREPLPPGTVDDLEAVSINSINVRQPLD
jgi:hypothetical protein